MALHIAPQLAQQQVQLRVQPTNFQQSNFNNSQTSDFSHGLSCNQDHAAIPEMSKSSEPTEECLTVDLSNPNFIHFSKWNGQTSKILVSNTINPPFIGLSNGKVIDTTFPISEMKSNLQIISGQSVVKRDDDSKFSPQIVLKRMAILNEKDIQSNKHDILIKSMAIFFDYCMTIGYPTNTDSSTVDKKAAKSTTTSTKKSKSKSSKLVRTLTVVLSNIECSSMAICHYLLTAAKLAKVTIRNIFSKDLAQVSYLYHQHASIHTPILNNKSTLFLQENTDYYIFNINLSNDLEGSNLTLSIIHCEVNTKSGVTDRMVIVSSQQIDKSVVKTDLDMLDTHIKALLGDIKVNK